MRNFSWRSWDFSRIPENHSREFPENSLALICTNIPENSREFLGSFWNRNRLKILGRFSAILEHEIVSFLILGSAIRQNRNIDKFPRILRNSQELSEINLTVTTYIITKTNTALLQSYSYEGCKAWIELPLFLNVNLNKIEGKIKIKIREAQRYSTHRVRWNCWLPVFEIRYFNILIR